MSFRRLAHDVDRYAMTIVTLYSLIHEKMKSMRRWMKNIRINTDLTMVSLLISFWDLPLFWSIQLAIFL
jgi:hypothetical protein